MQNKYLAMTPPMGWNSWNTFTWNINEDLVCGAADALCASGLKDKGYEYVVIDDCWSLKQRDENGRLVPDPEKFPHGMKAVADYVHSKGLKFGMYSCCGTHTCAGYPGSFEHEFVDAETFASWGVDYLKYDNCYKPKHMDGEVLYKRMSLALRNCGRDIVLSACNWGNDEVSRWIRSAGAHMYRSTGDINDSFRSFADIALSQIDNLAYSAPGCFNDIDMLTVGMYGRGNVGSVGCSDVDYKTQFALWCMFSSPLMLGGDLRCMNDFCLDLVKNERLIRINQDEESRPAFVATKSWNDKIVFAKLLSNNEIAILFVNFSESKCGVPFYFENIGISAASGYGLEMTDAFTGECIGVKKEFMQMHLEAHDCACFICKLKK